VRHHYIAIVEDAGPTEAVGIWFPDLPGCFSAGDTVEEAMENAPQAIAVYAEALARDGRALPQPRSLVELKSDAQHADELRDHMIALVAAPRPPEAA
jgi:predicted RNase H-like HicB family nuclease